MGQETQSELYSLVGKTEGSGLGETPDPSTELLLDLV